MSRIASRDRAALRVMGRLSRSDLLWVANTAHGPGGHWHARVRGGEPDHDHLASPETAREYLGAHGVPIPDEAPDDEALAELAIVRSMVHALAGPQADHFGREASRFLAATTFALHLDGLVASTEGSWPGFCRDLLIPLLALVPDRERLSRCANPACRLLFEDGSRNHGRRWCDTAGCGNRDRVRRARRRRDDGPPDGGLNAGLDASPRATESG